MNRQTMLQEQIQDMENKLYEAEVAKEHQDQLVSGIRSDLKDLQEELEELEKISVILVKVWDDARIEQHVPNGLYHLVVDGCRYKEYSASTPEEVLANAKADGWNQFDFVPVNK